MTVEGFAEYWRDKNPCPESRMAQRFLTAREDFEAVHNEMLQHLRPKARGKTTLLVLRDAEAVVARFERAEKTLLDIESDIVRFEELAGNHTLDMLARERQRLKRALDDADFSVKSATLRTIKNNKARSAAEASTTAEVVDLLAKRDRVAEHSVSRLQDIESRIARAREILKKY